MIWLTDDIGALAPHERGHTERGGEKGGRAPETKVPPPIEIGGEDGIWRGGLCNPQVEEERKIWTPLTPSAMKTEAQGGFTNRELLAYNLLTHSKGKLLSKLILGHVILCILALGPL